MGDMKCYVALESPIRGYLRKIHTVVVSPTLSHTPCPLLSTRLIIIRRKLYYLFAVAVSAAILIRSFLQMSINDQSSLESTGEPLLTLVTSCFLLCILPLSLILGVYVVLGESLIISSIAKSTMEASPSGQGGDRLRSSFIDDDDAIAARVISQVSSTNSQSNANSLVQFIWLRIRLFYFQAMHLPRLFASLQGSTRSIDEDLHAIRDVYAWKTCQTAVFPLWRHDVAVRLGSLTVCAWIDDELVVQPMATPDKAFIINGKVLIYFISCFVLIYGMIHT